MKALLFLLLLASPAAALQPALPPGAVEVIERTEPLISLRLPITTLQAGEVQSLRAEGALRQRVWQVPDTDRSLPQIAAPLRAQLLEGGYTILLDCAARACGGFQFRFATNTLPAPEMYVDLGNFRYISAQRAGEAGPEWVSLMISSSPTRGFVQLTEVTPTAAPAAAAATPQAALPGDAATLANALRDHGRAVLWDLVFPTGSTALGGSRLASLDALAEVLASDPATRITLVGHTDAVGSLTGNIEVSRSRAEAVRARLIEVYDIDPARIRAEGVGYLAPLTSNATPAGRDANRRVEVVLDEQG